MIDIIEKSSKTHDRNSIESINKSTTNIFDRQNMANLTLNRSANKVAEANIAPNRADRMAASLPGQKRMQTQRENLPQGLAQTSPQTQTWPQNPSQTPSQSLQSITIPALHNLVRKGQKVQLALESVKQVDVRLGWNVLNAECDIDVSAFMLNQHGRVIGDSWFVFYGQEDSPDKSTHFSVDAKPDREQVSVTLSKLNSEVQKIVFVLTINDALQKNLNFSMVKDAYIRILDHNSNNEIVSFKMDEYYSNVISMMIGELYIHNGAWKFNAIGNGVAKDLAGLCELYGVQVL